MDKNLAGIGGIIRNSNGQLVQRFVKAISVTSPLEGAIRAIPWGMRMGADLDVPNLLIKSDSAQAINWIMAENVHQTFLPNVLLSSRSLIHSYLGWRITWTCREANEVAHDLAEGVWKGIYNMYFTNIAVVMFLLSEDSLKELNVGCNEHRLMHIATKDSDSAVLLV